MNKESEAIHDEYMELLPWYVNESLSDKERIRVMAHLSECGVCRAERDQLQLLQNNVLRDDLEVSDYRFSYSKLMKRIDASEQNKESADELVDFDLAYSSTAGRTSNWDVRWPVFATAASLVIGVFLLASNSAFVGTSNPVDSQYQTLSKVTDRSGLPHRVNLSFHPSLEALELREILSDLQSTMISGPDVDGIYVVELDVPVQLTDADFIRHIQGKEGVKDAVFTNAHVNP